LELCCWLRANFSPSFIITTTNRDGDDRGSNSSSGGEWYLCLTSGSVLIGFGFLSNYDSHYQRRQEQSQLNFFEAIFSFLFGDGNPNANLEERRWQQIATVIRNNGEQW